MTKTFGEKVQGIENDRLQVFTHELASMTGGRLPDTRLYLFLKKVYGRGRQDGAMLQREFDRKGYQDFTIPIEVS